MSSKTEDEEYMKRITTIALMITNGLTDMIAETCIVNGQANGLCPQCLMRLVLLEMLSNGVVQHTTQNEEDTIKQICMELTHVIKTYQELARSSAQSQAEPPLDPNRGSGALH